MRDNLISRLGIHSVCEAEPLIRALEESARQAKEDQPGQPMSLYSIRHRFFSGEFGGYLEYPLGVIRPVLLSEVRPMELIMDDCAFYLFLNRRGKSYYLPESTYGEDWRLYKELPTREGVYGED